MFKSRFILTIATLTIAWRLSTALAQPAAEPAKPSATDSATSSPTLHPALFLVGDSIMKTGMGNGERGPWGWGSEISTLFDAGKIHVYNEGHGGRTGRSFIAEGLWADVLKRIEPGDFVIIQFGHNEAANSQNFPDRISAKGNGDETQEISAPKTGEKETIHTYGWYLRQLAADAKAKGATVIICSPVPRNTWIDGKIKRGFDGYAGWAAEAAKQSGALFIDLNTLAADKYDALGQQKAASYFNDNQHTTKPGAHLNAEAVVEGLKQLKDCPLTSMLAAAPAENVADSSPKEKPADAAKEKPADAAPASAVEPVPQTVLDKIYDEVKTPFKYGVVIPREGDEWIDCPSVFRFNDHWYMMYVKYTPKIGYESMLARSDDLLHWEKLGPILSFRKEGWDAWQADAGIALVDPTWGGSSAPEKFDGKYWCSYIGGNLKGMEPDPLSTGIAWSLTPDKAAEWNRIDGNPVLSGSDADARPWEKTTLFKTSIIRDPQQRFGAPFLMYYNGRTKPSLESIGMAISKDMIHWKRFGPQEPLVIDPENGKGTGISGDPQLVKMQIDGKDVWVMFYFGFRWAGPGAFDTFAASTDLLHWTKWRGPHLIQPSAKDEPTTFDNTFAHKPWVVKHDGVVYHFYCSVGKGEGRQIAVATSKDMKSKE